MPEAAVSLEEFMNADLDARTWGDQNAPEEQTERFKIMTQEQADWAVRKIARTEHNLKEAIETAQKEIDKVNAWLADQKEKAENDKGYFVGLLEAYHRQLFLENPRLKTIKLPHGSLQLRVQQPDFGLGENLLEWVKQNNLPYVEVIEKLKWGELKGNLIITEGKAVLKDTGEVIEDITVTERDMKFSVKVQE
jgi:hypothetical protein